MSLVGRNLKSDHSNSNPLHEQGCQLIKYLYDEVQELWFSHWLSSLWFSYWLSSSTGWLKMWKTIICLLSNWMKIWKNDYNFLKLAHAEENNYSDKTKSIDFSECQSDDQELNKSSHHLSSSCAPSSRITEDCLQ